MSADLSAELPAIYKSIGIDEKTYSMTLKNTALLKTVKDVVTAAGVLGKGCDSAMGKLLYHLATNAGGKTTDANLALIGRAIGEGKIDKVRIIAATKLAVAAGQRELTLDELNKTCGVGVVVSDAEITAAVRKSIEADKATIVEERYHFNSGKALGGIGQELPFADGAKLREEYDKQLAALLGPKTDDDLKPPTKKKAAPAAVVKQGVKKGGQVANTGVVAADGASPAEEAWIFPSPKANLANNKPHILAKHLDATGGKVVTRFPPEPNGYLHIGHAKAMHLDFGYGSRLGECLLRYDDTNPEAESQEYIDSIANSVAWLGHKPSRVTYSSDYFEELYALAVELIKRGKAYVCHQQGADTKEYRRLRKDSPWRDRPISENLRIFDEMRRGLYGEGEAWLRMKIDMKSDNPVLRDPCAYRIKYCAHPHVGNKWCIYPSYDFTHCIIDSIENVTHSLCTLEFDIRRASYYWLLDALDLYKPLVWEFSRLQFEDLLTLDDDRDWRLITTLSKRKLLALVMTGGARGWDDPRMPTLDGLRRRGFTPQSINQLCEDIGVTRGIQRIPFRRLEQCLRQDLDARAPRRFGVLRPLKCVVTNFNDVSLRSCLLPNHPADESMGKRVLPFTSTIYIDQDDFRLVDDDDFFGLAPGKEVGLRYACNIKCDGVVKDTNGNVVELRVTCDPVRKNKTKGHLHWLPDPASHASRRCEVRLYEWLFHSRVLVADSADAAANEEAAARAGGAEELDVDAPVVATSSTAEATPLTSEIVLRDCLVEANTPLVPFFNFQMERVGFFTVDPDTDTVKNVLVLNRSVGLKEDKGKKALKK